MPLKSLYSPAIILILLFTFFAMSNSYAGKASGGGGGVVERDSGLVLVDFFQIESKFEDSNQFWQWQASRISNLSNRPFKIDKNNEAQLRKDNQSLNYALNLLEQWSNQVFDIVGFSIILGFRDPLQWQFTKRNLNDPNFYKPNSLSESDKIQFAAYYTKFEDAKFVVDINEIIWNQMGVKSQAGLFIHEALRHLQFGWSNSFDEKSLQRAVAILMLCKPKQSLNYYVNYLVQNRPDIAESIYGDFDSFIKTECERPL